MAVVPILRWPDARLGTACDAVVPQDPVSGIVADLFDTMYDAPGRGLAAPQIGVMKRVFVIDTTWKEGRRTPRVFVNPCVLGCSEQIVEAEETCLSIPGIATVVARPVWVAMTWGDAKGRQYARRFVGVEARCVQHEMDHLDGLVTLHRLKPEARARADAAYAALS